LIPATLNGLLAGEHAPGNEGRKANVGKNGKPFKHLLREKTIHKLNSVKRNTKDYGFNKSANCTGGFSKPILYHV
jgi:hypothetical protein